ncbi:hypothetical protein ROHU_000496 [Labeo rohita]|uniref:Uncharacterized protein n=1 Tax=Labeo rohita TaxID=84645 RepID=A0A498P5B8_LABRO|nr:hypothetical protein ROHU_000496 [Labeo rohita]
MGLTTMAYVMFCTGLLMLTNRCSSYECPTTQETLCENLVSSKGYTYQVPQDKIPDLRDCEHGWYHLNGTFIVDATYQAENLGFVVSVTTENLTVSTCINIQWQLECDDIQFQCFINYTVKHQVTHEPLPGNDTSSGGKEDANTPEWLIAVIVGIGIASVFIMSITI